MSNRLKMVQKELIFMLLSQNWSIRKINIAKGIHRATISRYKKEYQDFLQTDSKTTSQDSELLGSPNSIQSVPPAENKVPTDKVVHFQVPYDSRFLLKLRIGRKSVGNL